MKLHTSPHKKVCINIRINSSLHQRIMCYMEEQHISMFTQAVEEILHFGFSKLHEMEVEAERRRSHTQG